jgi:hypothetical protein
MLSDRLNDILQELHNINLDYDKCIYCNEDRNNKTKMILHNKKCIVIKLKNIIEINKNV